MKLHSSVNNWVNPTELHIGVVLWNQVKREIAPSMTVQCISAEQRFDGLKVHIDHNNPCTLGVR